VPRAESREIPLDAGPRYRRALGLLIGLASTLAASPARAEETAPEPAHFYKGLDYGSQALFNPLTVFLNRGFDVLQLRSNDSLFDQNWRVNSGNVLHNVASPFAAVSSEGWGKWLREEIFPLTWGIQGARWAPNYGLHLIGGGQTFAALREWYIAHDVPLPALFSVATLFAAAFANESLENKDVVGVNTDCLADLYVFDVLGVLLFSSETMRGFFSKYVIVSDWSLQPSFTVTNGYLRNAGNYYSLKMPIPYYERLRLFGYIGMSTLGGLSYQLERGYSASIAFGAKVSSFESAANGYVYNVIEGQPAAAVFVDRNDSLLVSLEVANVQDNYARLNIYPNAFFKMDPSIGLWAALTKNGHVMAGISVTRALGLGAAVGNP
jgi:hypothetical protein